MLDQTVLFISAEPALAHRYHDNPKNRLSGTAPNFFTTEDSEENKEKGLERREHRGHRDIIPRTALFFPFFLFIFFSLSHLLSGISLSFSCDIFLHPPYGYDYS
jgi:hypothetical protein